MERCGDGENDRLLCALLLEQLNRSRDALFGAGDDRLPRAVEVDGLHCSLCACRSTGVDDRRVVQTDDRRHRALTHGHGLLHIGTALVHEHDGVTEGERPRENERCVLTETVSARDRRGNAAFLQQLRRNHGDGEDGRLGILGQLELIRRPLKAELADGVAECLICLGKTLLCEVIGIVEVSAHADDLCPLSREQKCKFSHSGTP